MDEPDRRPRRRTMVLTAFLWSVAVNAALAIWALVSEEFGSTQGKILASSLLVSASMLSVLVNGPAIERRVLWPVPLLGAGLAAGAFLFLIVLLWFEVDAPEPLKLAASALVLGAATTLGGVLALLDLRSGHVPVRLSAFALIAALAVTVVFAIWSEIDRDWLPRLIGVESVLVAAFTLAIPALSKFLPRAELPAARGWAATVRFCPVCGGDVEAGPPPVVIVCPHCDAAYGISTAQDPNGLQRSGAESRSLVEG